MAKGLPYFKFIPTEWLTGNIVYEPLDVQGAFINVCAIYWQRDGKLSVEEVERRIKKPTALQPLFDRFFEVNGSMITIRFLDEQLHERNHISQVNSENGSKGGRPKTQDKKPTANRPLTETKPKKSQEEKEVEIKEEVNKIEERKLKFASTLEPFKNSYSRDLLNAFYKYWTEPNKSNTKFRQELERTWEISRRLETWAARDKSFTKPMQNQQDDSRAQRLMNM